MPITIRNNTSTKAKVVKMALSKLNRNTLRAAALSGLLSLSPAFSANADSSESQYYDNYVDAGQQARKYAQEENGIGIVISYGAYDNAPTPEAVGSKFQEAFASLGEPSAYFIVEDDTPGYSLSFDNPYTGTEPMSIRDAAKAISGVVEDKRRFEGYLVNTVSRDLD